MKKRLINILLLSFWSGLSFAQAPTNSKNFVLESTVRAAGHKTGESLKLSPVDSVNRVIKYMDGLGRPLQVVNWMASPNKKDLVQSFEYDGFGREVKKYQPYAEQTSADAGYKTNAGVNLAAFYGSSSWDNTIKQTAYPFSLSVLEPSPLNRLKEQGATGANWQPGTGHTMKMEYGTNGENEVKLWVVNSEGASSSWWPAGRLYKTVSKDENWVSGKTGTTDEFKDFEGRVVLKKVWESESKSLSTYYVYDDLGNLRYVLPPAVNEGGQYGLNSFREYEHVFTSFIYGYHYDSRNRLLEKKIPGKGWEWIFNNKLDQVIITQDANQRNKPLQEGSFTKYDAMGRVIITGVMDLPGIVADSSVASPSRQYRDFLPFLETETVLWESRDNNDPQTGYTSLAVPQSTIVGAPINRTYRTINYYDDYDFNGNTYGGPSSTQVGSTKTKGLLTGTKVALEGTTDMILTVYYYDEEGRVIQTRAKIGQFGTDVTDNTYNFAGELTSSLRSYVAFDQTTTIANRYQYDHQGRKTLSFSKINNQPEVTLSGLAYNELGQLKTKSLHGSNGASFAQHTDFRYNERGWLKSSTSNEFSIELKYDEGTFSQFNGNISGQRWGAGLSLPNTYNYEYDQLNRLTKAVSTGVSMSEELDYDELGNIRNLNRDNSGLKTYHYDGNRLLNVTGLTGNYAYDANGNAVKDGRNGMDLVYNVLNLPVSASDGSNQVNYVYDATGRKLAKYFNGNYRGYVDGIESNGPVIDLIHTEEGVAQNNGGTYTYQYNLTDHLGNVRYTFDIYGGAVRRLQSDDYYAFGKRKSSGSPVSLNNKYLYNGKEVQDELGEQLDYGARFYDPTVGRWNVIDPLAESYQSFSPYNYVLNSPLTNTDPDGRSVNTRFVNSLGQTIINTDDGRNDVIEVAGNRIKEFKENIASFSHNTDALNLAGWNDYWRGEKGFTQTISGEYLDKVGYNGLSSDASKTALVKYLYSHSTSDWTSFLGKEVKAQWTPTNIILALISFAHGTIGTIEGLQARGGTGPRPSPNFKTPTNSPQLPPSTVPSGYNLRVMPATQQYPNGYWVIEKPMPQGGFQKVNPSTMKPGTQAETHVPLPRK